MLMSLNKVFPCFIHRHSAGEEETACRVYPRKVFAFVRFLREGWDLTVAVTFMMTPEVPEPNPGC